MKNSVSTNYSFIDCPTAAAAAAIPSSYFVLAILDQPFRSTVTKCSFTTSSAIESSASIKCFTIKSSTANCFVFTKYTATKCAFSQSLFTEDSFAKYSVLFYLLHFTG